MRKLIAAFSFYLALVGAASATGEPQVSTITNTPTYIAGLQVTNTGGGDVMCIYGSATKTIWVTEMHMTGIATAAITIVETIIKRSAVDTGGTTTPVTIVPLNSYSPTATATVTGYTVSPTPGTSVGAIDTRFIPLGTSGNTAAMMEAEANFGNLSDQPVTLHGTSEGVCFSVGPGGAGASYAMHIRWMEQ